MNGRVVEEYQWSAVGLQAGAGLEWRVWNRLSVLGEYKWTYGRPRLDVNEGAATLTTRSQHLALGLAAAF